jgi:hypothetical protein
MAVVMVSLCGLSGAVFAADEDLSACGRLSVEQKLRCYQERLEAAIQSEGTEQALSLLEALTKQDADAEREAHPLVHHIGQRSFVHYGEAARAMSHCRDIFWSGCYHGVLQAYLGSLPVVESHHIVALCPPVSSALDFSFKRYNCLHGLGHGVTLQFHYDLLKSLAYCDYLTGEWDRESCYGGVFMENIVTFQNAQQTGQGHAHHAHPQPASFMNAQDLLYPCSALNSKYLRSCYLMQTSAILTFLNYDFGQTFLQCERVTAEHQATCYRSLGRDISGYTLRDAERVTRLCGLGRGDQVRQCLIGAVKDFILTDASPDPGLALCRRLDGPFKQDCYGTVGEMVATLYSDRARRDEACRKSEMDYVEVCLALVRAY